MESLSWVTHLGVANQFMDTTGCTSIPAAAGFRANCFEKLTKSTTLLAATSARGWPISLAAREVPWSTRVRRSPDYQRAQVTLAVKDELPWEPVTTSVDVQPRWLRLMSDSAT